MTQKIYELTTDGSDGYYKYYVKGLKSDEEARALAKQVFKKHYWDAQGGISYYDDYPSKYGNDSRWKKVPGKKAFIKQMKEMGY